MYVYKSGLICRVSEKRVNAYESIVPPVLVVMLIVGTFLILQSNAHPGIENYRPVLFKSFTDGFLMIAEFSALIISVVGLGMGTFHYWCKPDWDSSEKKDPVKTSLID